jgi:glycosyltransferase 2 family protein
MSEAAAGGSPPTPVAAPPRSRRWPRVVVGALVSLVALYLAGRKTSWREVQGALSGVAWGWLPVMAALKVAVLWIKDVRWRVELDAMKPGVYRGTFRAVALGYFGNVLVPFRLGELMRVGLLRRKNPGLDLGGALATVAAERALDGAVLSLMVAAALPFAEVPANLVRGSIILLVVMLGVVAVAMFTPLHDLALRILPARGPLRLVRAVIDALSRGTAVLRRPRYLALAALYTALAWLAEGLVVWAAIRALGLPLGFADSLVITLLLSVALLVPSAPGQVGTHQLMTAYIVVPFGVAQAAAISLSLVMQAVAIVVLGGLGGWVMITESAARGAADAGRPTDPDGPPPAPPPA